MDNEPRIETMKKTFTNYAATNLAVKVCHALGLDSNRVTGLVLTFEPHSTNTVLTVEIELWDKGGLTEKLTDLDWTLDDNP